MIRKIYNATWIRMCKIVAPYLIATNSNAAHYPPDRIITIFGFIIVCTVSVFALSLLGFYFLRFGFKSQKAQSRVNKVLLDNKFINNLPNRIEKYMWSECVWNSTEKYNYATRYIRSIEYGLKNKWHGEETEEAGNNLRKAKSEINILYEEALILKLSGVE